MSESITVFAAINKAYVQHLGVMLCSLFENNKGERICAHLLCDAWDDPGRSRLERLAEHHRQQIQFVTVNRARFARFPISLHLDLSTYYRILCPDYLPPELDRALYLDSDIVIRGNLGELWTIDLHGAALAAVADSPGILHERGSALGLTSSRNYFNAGVLLIDLVKWRTEAIADKLVAFIDANLTTLAYMDQDALNAVLAHDWQELTPRWNRQQYHFQNPDSASASSLLRDTDILHFTGRSKPWHYLDRHPGKREYLRYLAKTEWRDYVPPDRSPGNFLRKYGLMPACVQRLIERRATRPG